jgi:hypothetical protein
LLLMSVSAATSLAEERVRGSLDVLLSTPMSNRSILAGKWWGTFRQVWPVAFWPALFGGGAVLVSGEALAFFVLVSSVLAYGAVITSLGLALATWVSRLGRAVALCVTVYVVFSVGWPLLVASMFRPEPTGRPLVFGSPAIGAFAGMAVVAEHPHDPIRQEYRVGGMFWLLVHLLIAKCLFAATVSSFDRCLGRMPDYGEPQVRSKIDEMSDRE